VRKLALTPGLGFRRRKGIFTVPVAKTWFLPVFAGFYRTKLAKTHSPKKTV
jgi:hypothetical protein